MATELIDQLSSKDIHERADVGRQLSRTGELRHIERLVEHAFKDPSPGVRLYSVGAVADILSRYRVGAGAAELDQAARRAILKSVQGFDPEVNPGVFSILANLGLPRAARRILVGLQDPRLDVRTGAVVGVYRYFVSHAAAADELLKADLLKLFNSERLSPDARAAVVRLCAQCGWQDTEPLLTGMLSRGDQVSEAAEQALADLRTQADPASLRGFWRGYGADAGEITDQKEPNSSLYIGEHQAFLVEGGEAIVGPWSLKDGRLVIGEFESDLRRMVLDEPSSHEQVPALQLEERSFYRHDKAVLAALEQFLTVEVAADKRAPFLAELLELLPDGAAGRRVAARLEMASGAGPQALERMLALTAKKKGVAADDWFFLGQAYALAGKQDLAREAWDTFQAKATKNNPLRGQVPS